MITRFLVAAPLLALVGCASTPPPGIRAVKLATTMSTSNQQTANCPSDSAVVGGGFEIPATARAQGKVPTVIVNRPTENGWMVQCLDAAGQPSSECKAYVVCAIVVQ